MEQGSDKWLKWRNNGIGASDISILMGSNPYKTPFQLWEDKCGYKEPEKMNKAMRHGVKNEPRARKWINDNMMLNFKPICVEDEDESIFKASLDGYDIEENFICEIKCPVREKILEEAKNNQRVPDYWFHQMQWQIMITKCERALFVLWDYRYENCYKIEMFGEPNIHHVMRKKALEFWHHVRIGKAPPLAPAETPELEKDEELERLLKKYITFVHMEKEAKEGKESLRESILSYGKGSGFKAYGFTITKLSPRTQYNMDQMRIDGIDVDKYIKKSDKENHFKIMSPTNEKIQR